jgi:hypothetical protein
LLGGKSPGFKGAGLPGAALGVRFGPGLAVGLKPAALPAVSLIADRDLALVRLFTVFPFPFSSEFTGLEFLCPNRPATAVPFWSLSPAKEALEVFRSFSRLGPFALVRRRGGFSFPRFAKSISRSGHLVDHGFDCKCLGAVETLCPDHWFPSRRPGGGRQEGLE